MDDGGIEWWETTGRQQMLEVIESLEKKERVNNERKEKWFGTPAGTVSSKPDQQTS